MEIFVLTFESLLHKVLYLMVRNNEKLQSHRPSITIHSKLTIGVNVSVNSMNGLCFSGVF